MSVKRQATSELNHDNWNDEDPTDDKEMGQFKPASKDVLEKRVIRTARRRNPISSEPSKSVFSGFGGFNKTQQPSFDFLANLTNGSKNTNGSTSASNSETTTTSSLFSNKPTTNSGGLFSSQTVSTSAPSKTTQSSTWSSPFGSTAKTSSSSLFTATSTTAKETPFKIQPTSSSSNIDSTKPTTTSVFVSSTGSDNKASLFTSTSFKSQAVSSTTTATVQTTFGTKPAMTSVTPEKKSDGNEIPNEKKIKYFSKLKGLNEAVSDWINKHVAQTPLCILSPIFKDYEKYLKEITEEYQIDKEEQDKKMDTEATGEKTGSTDNTKINTFGINNSSPFSSTSASLGTKSSTPFPTKNTNSSPFKNQDTKISTTPFGNNISNSSPFTSSYKQDLKSSPFGSNIERSAAKQDSKTSTPFAMNKSSSSPSKSDDTKVSTPFGIKNTATSTFNSSPSNQDTKTNTPFAISNTTSPFTTSPSSASKTSLFGAQDKVQSSPDNKQASFSFGIKTPSNTSLSSPSTGFSFETAPVATTSAATSPFSTNTNSTSAAPFSFGIGKPFSFSSNNVQQSSGETPAKENEDEEPPKVEYTPVKEDNSVYEKKCKIFVKKDGNFADKGVGTLYIKKIEGNVKHQLLVRANTNLGTVLLNLVLAEAIPTQRMGKNNVMLVCIPTPETKPPPTPVLIRVKTGEEADELLETLNKYKA